MKNYYMARAHSVKNDEFYTQYADIERELINYKQFLVGKIVYCNCSDPYKSNFAKYFVQNFNEFGLGGLFVSGIALQGKATALKIYAVDAPVHSNEEYTKFLKQNTYEMNGNGSFDSDESINLLKMCDVVIDNPPFSLTNRYFDVLFSNKKKFLIIGNQNAIVNSRIFPRVLSGELHFGFNMIQNFEIPAKYVNMYKNVKVLDGKYFKQLGFVCWFTNIEIGKQKNDLELLKAYNPAEYPKYDNSDVINCDKVADIPRDYNGVIGVPISFVHKWNLQQFKIVGKVQPKIDGKCIYQRILIQRTNHK